MLVVLAEVKGKDRSIRARKRRAGRRTLSQATNLSYCYLRPLPREDATRTRNGAVPTAYWVRVPRPSGWEGGRKFE